MTGIFAASDDSVVATETGPEHRIMINLVRLPAGSAMAVLAGLGRRDVAGIFSFRDSVVVAEHAITFYIDMVEAPVVGRMAVVADVGAGNMSGVFTLGNDAVVATHATADNHGMIDARNARPGIRGMAKIAITDYAYMPAGSCAGLYASRIGMAGNAAPGRADKNTLQVAGLAGCLGVPVIQREVGFVMIKIRAKVQSHGAICANTANQ